MGSAQEISHVVLDFDGTCTQIPRIWEAYLDLYLKGLRRFQFDISDSQWREAHETVRKHSPKAGWTLAGCPAAPAAADPYILADESVRLILRRRGDHRTVPPDVNREAYDAAAAPWREEAADTFSRLIERGIRLFFVSNSSTAIITRRLQELATVRPALKGKIDVQSDAGKFRICELNWENQTALRPEARATFEGLPAAWTGEGSDSVGRPLYLRRGSYFEAVCRVLGGDIGRIHATVFCGDIWEMDLAMPYALGARVHLLDRAALFDTYPFERRAAAAGGVRAKASVDLTGLLDWV
jgi:FMN phosphatase YigB (HAD superfamily)